VRITAPARDAVIDGAVTLTATANDPENGNLGARVRWFDDTGAFLGQGASIVATLTPGNRIITARALDFSGVEGQWSVRLTVLPPVVANFTFSCTQLTCSFNPAGSSGAGTLGVFWTFPAGIAVPPGPTPTVTFPASGSYPVTLRVRDSRGREASTTRVVTVTGPAPVVVPRAGSWFNPARSGHGLDLFSTNGQWIVAWYTYTPGGEPIWYLTDVAPLANNTFSSTLYSFTWNGSSTNRHTVGAVSLAFTSETTARFSYTVSGASGAEDFQLLAGGQGRSGAWFEPALSGWGIQIQEQPGFYGASVAFYEGSQPRWVLGSTTPGPVVVMALSWFPGPGLGPGCVYQGSPTPTPAGWLELNVADGAASGFATTLITTPSGWTWNRSGVSIAKLTD
jgi:hypothetical protein